MYKFILFLSFLSVSMSGMQKFMPAAKRIRYLATKHILPGLSLVDPHVSNPRSSSHTQHHK